MKVRRFLIPVHVFVAFALFSSAAYAQTPNITVNINGTVIGPSPSPLTIPPGPYGVLTISSYLGKPPQVVTSDESASGTTDSLTLKYATISTTATGTFSITFESSNFVAPPSSSPGNPVWYYALASGSFGRPGPAQLAIGDSITLTGKVDRQHTGAWDTIQSPVTKIVCGMAGCNTFSANTFKTLKEPYDITSPRGLRGEISFTLNNAIDRLNISEVTVKQGDPPGRGGDKVCEVEACTDFTNRSEEGFLCRVLNICGPCVIEDTN